MKKIFLRPKNRQKTSYYRKASQEYYVCFLNRVLTGRCHSGDENGQTRYATAIVRFNGKDCMTCDRVSSSLIKESKGIWCCSDSERVMTGRHHTGDENGITYYNYSKLYSLEPSIEPAPKGTRIVPDKRMQSESMKESQSSFLCPSNMVLTGRLHSGDENGNTVYEYASLKAISVNGEVIEDADITVQNVTWVEYEKESTGEGYDAPYGKVIVGRRHSGDENGGTAYAIGDVFYNGHPTYISNYHISAPKKESDGVWFKVNDDSVITARHHYGDENGTTYYGFGTIVCDEPAKPDEKIVLHVKMHSEDPYFPMHPVDYIRLSRLRRHVKGGTDYGYNKNTNTFVKGDSHSSEYYDIPLSVIMNQHTYGKYELMNLRPYDLYSIGEGEVFLQPDDHLTGDSNPNYRVPCIVHYVDKSTVSYWFFFGYDYAKAVAGTISFSHQGDWECVTVNLDDNGRIKSASLSCHTGANNHPVSELEIVHGEKDELTVYCAKGSHAFYNKPGTYNLFKLFGIVDVADDQTDNMGYDWVATNCVVSLTDDSQIWKYFAGAWGEVGEHAATTGPLGPWQKCGELEKMSKNHNNPSLKSLIQENQVLLVIDESKGIIEESKKESEGGEVSVSNHENAKILYTYTHDGDENGITTYYFASLKAIDLYSNQDGNNITVEDLKWTEWHKQSESQDFFVTTEMQDENSLSRIITGREHKGDENGMTRYQTGVLRYKGKLVKIVPYPNADMCVYTSHKKMVYPKNNLVIVGIKHSGDENGITTYCQGYIVADK